jgi:hypothetical protein
MAGDSGRRKIMEDLKILALGDDCPIARKPRPYMQRRTVLMDPDGWSAMAGARPPMRDVVEFAPPGSIAGRALDRGK